jgi:hypothetical protein
MLSRGSWTLWSVLGDESHNSLLLRTFQVFAGGRGLLFSSRCARWLGKTSSMGCPLSVGGSCCPWAATIALIACGIAALAYLPPLEPAVQVGAPARTQLQTENTLPLDTPTYSRASMEFPCVDATCEAWLYVPKGLAEGERPPVVVMAHGMVRCCCCWLLCFLIRTAAVCTASVCARSHD